MCGSGAMSWVKNQRIATRRFSSSTPQSLGPLDLSFGGPVGVLHERAEVLGVPPLDVAPASARRRAARRRTPAPSRACGTAGSTSVAIDADQAVPGERVEQVERLVLGEAGDVGGRLDASSRRRRPTAPPASSCSASSSSPTLHSTVARSVRWRSGRSTGPVPSASSDVLEPGEQRRRCRAAGCGPPRARSPAAGRRGAGRSPRRRRVVVGQRRSRGGRPGPGRRTAARRASAASSSSDGRSANAGTVSGADRVLALGPQPQHGAARGEDRDAGARGEQLVEVGRDADHLLEVVEHEQRRASARSARPGRPSAERVPSIGGADGGGDARQHQRRLGDRRQRHEHRAAPAVALVESLADRDRQPGLADAARPGQRDQPHVRLREQRRRPRRCRPPARPARSTVTGSERAAAGPRRSPARPSGRREPRSTNRSLSSSARSSRTSRPSSRGVRERCGRSRRPPTGARRSSPSAAARGPAPAP